MSNNARVLPRSIMRGMTSLPTRDVAADEVFDVIAQAFECAQQSQQILSPESLDASRQICDSGNPVGGSVRSRRVRRCLSLARRARGRAVAQALEGVSGSGTRSM